MRMLCVVRKYFPDLLNLLMIPSANCDMLLSIVRFWIVDTLKSSRVPPCIWDNIGCSFQLDMQCKICARNGPSPLQNRPVPHSSRPSPCMNGYCMICPIAASDVGKHLTDLGFDVTSIQRPTSARGYEREKRRMGSMSAFLSKGKKCLTVDLSNTPKIHKLISEADIIS